MSKKKHEKKAETINPPSFEQFFRREGQQWKPTDNERASDLSVYYSGLDWIVKDREKSYCTRGTLSLDINEIQTMISGSCTIHSNELDNSEKYAICKEDEIIKIFQVTQKGERSSG